MTCISYIHRIILLFLVLCCCNCILFYYNTYLFQRKSQEWGDSNHCFVPSWNRIKNNDITNSFRKTFSRWLWMALDLSRENNQNYTSLSLIGAYVYPEYISITINSQSMVKQKVYCRYFDCKQIEIPGSQWEGVVFPESVVHCPRRAAAEFVSVSTDKMEDFPTSMKLKYRVFEKPPHSFSICVAPLYGNEPKWLQITEFIEHHKMEGATFFYFHIGNVSDYDRRILDEYEKNGEIEVKVLQEKYERPFYAWQLLEIQDCHMRSKFHSKWTAFIDIDERIVSRNGRFVDVLENMQDERVAEMQIPILNIPKTSDSPASFVNITQVSNEILLTKYIESAEPTWNASKALIRPDKIGIMSIHYVVALDPGFKTVQLDSKEVVVRHYRATQHRENGNNWYEMEQLYRRPVPSKFSKRLTKRVIEKVRFVYEKIPANCTTIPQEMWKSRKFPDPCVKMLLTW